MNVKANSIDSGNESSKHIQSQESKIEIFDNEDKTLNYKISHLVSADRLSLYIRVDLIDKASCVNHEDILDYIKEQGIVYGIKENDIIEYCKNGELSKELVAARGLEPINGTDAELIYNFDTSMENKLTEKEDGTIDFLNLNNIINVKKNELLCRIIPAKEGMNGIDIYAKKISYKRGKQVYFNSGKNTYVTEDGLQLLSNVDGCVKMIGTKVVVEDIYTVNNVDNETGNIDFAGSVIVKGDIRSGFTVKAKQDITVKGMVQGAYLEAGGEVIISKGVNGMGKGKIHAKGNITSKYIENVTVKSEKSIYAEMLINSDVSAYESIILKGPNASIIGGTSKACNMIYAPTVGSKANYETNLVIDLCKYQEIESKLEEFNIKKSRLQKSCCDKINDLKDLEDKVSILLKSNIENKNILHKSLIFKMSKIKSEIAEIKRALEQDIQKDNIADHKIICKGIMYVNTRISIGWMKYKVRQDINYSKIYNDGNDIAIVPLNPSDII